MKKVFLLMSIVLIACVTFTSCHEHELAEVIETAPTQPEIKFTEAELKLMETMNGDHKIKIADARRLALDAINSNRRQMRGTKFMGMRKNVDYEVVQESDLEEEVILCAPEVSMDEELQALDIKDTIAYAFREREGGGFMLIAADDRLEDPVLACIDNSDAFQSDSTITELESFILEQLEDFYISEIQRYSEVADSLENSINEKMNEFLALEDSIEGDASITGPQNGPKKIFPKLTFNVTVTPIEDWQLKGVKMPLTHTKWGQSWPYNNAVKNKNGLTNAYTGCVATAIAQIMAYWKFPARVGGINMNWNSLTSSPFITSDSSIEGFQVAHLMKTIGESIGMEYKINGSNANMKTGRNWMKNIGYVDGREHDYDFNKVVSSLINNRPVLMGGFSHSRKKKVFLIFSKRVVSDGHAWVVDGYSSKERSVERNLEIRSANRLIYSKKIYYVEKKDFLHCNWGWNGSCNGWYPAGCFDTNMRPMLDNEVLNGKKNAAPFKVESGNDGNYQYKKLIYVNLRPNNL